MPQIKAAKKDLRKNSRRRAVNDLWRKRIREAIAAVRDAIASGDATALQASYTKAQSTLDRAARRHILHRREANRQKAKLSRKALKQG